MSQAEKVSSLYSFNVTNKEKVKQHFSNVRRFQSLELQPSEAVCGDESIDDFNNSSQKQDNFEFFTDIQQTLPLIQIQHDSEIVEPNPLEFNEPLTQIGLSCTCCELTFSDFREQREHFKLDWHRHNLKRKHHGQSPITEPEFDEMLDGLSSISGSDSDDEISSTACKLSKAVDKLKIYEGASFPETERLGNKDSPRSRSAKVYVESDSDKIIGIYRAILPMYPKLQRLVDNECENSFHSNVLDVSSDALIAIVMISAGHFAASIFEGCNEIRHKTIHRYTVRAKQGGSQSKSDNKTGGAKSAGASLRRHNELALVNEIQVLLNSWEEELSKCCCIFYRLSNSNQNILFGGKNPVFRKDNPKIKSIPVQTKRPTFSETKRVLFELTTFEIYDRSTFIEQLINNKEEKRLNENEKKKSPKKHSNRNIDRAKSRSPKRREDPRVISVLEAGEDDDIDESSSKTELLITDELILEEIPVELNLATELQEYETSVRKPERKPRSKPSVEKVKIEPWGIVVELLSGIKKNDSSSKTEDLLVARLRDEAQGLHRGSTNSIREEFVSDLNQVVDSENSRILHIGVKHNYLDLVWLLLECGADPTMKDKSGKYPYNWSPSKECRNLFRKFRGKYPEKYDYEKAQIPGPLTDQMEQEIVEKKKIQNKLKREKEKQKKMEKKEKEMEEDEQGRFLNLSDREKRALAAERRLLGQCQRNGESKPILLRCFDCGVDITGKVPFEYNENKFCSTKCLATHRKKFPTLLSA